MADVEALKRRRDTDRKKFAVAVEGLPTKIQVGARGKKIAPDWIAIDLFDKSELIDHNWDLTDLPLEDQSVDCFLCNAVLEHVIEPHLAIYEMYRTLKVGGYIWVEVPFNQVYHAHPHDFKRWTVQGLEWDMRRFEKRGSGYCGNMAEDVPKVLSLVEREGGLQIGETNVQVIADVMRQYLQNTRMIRMYPGVYFSGVKTSHNILEDERAFMNRVRDEARAYLQK